MKASELRIGNLVKDGNDFEQVTIYHLDCLSIGRCEFDPIPLTEEWLLKFGFTNNKLGEFECQDWNEESWVFLWNEFVISTNLKYVHQLQNLYFALTDEELTLKS